MDAMNTNKKMPKPEGLSKGRCGTALEGMGSHGLGRGEGLGFAGSRRIQINTGQGFTVRRAEEHHTGVWDAVALPIADAWHGKAEDA